MFYKKLFTCLLGWSLALISLHYTGLDLKFQSLFYDFTEKHWMIKVDDLTYKMIFYKFPKICIVAYGVFILLKLIYLKIRKVDQDTQKKLLYLVLSLISVPVVVAIFKHYSPVVCPSRIVEFGGDKAYVSPLDVFAKNIVFNGLGKCFPAGHASGGFALISLYFVAKNRKNKKIALVGSLLLGTIMGMYQIAKGMHYLSDTFTTLVIAYLISFSLYHLLYRQRP